MIINAVIFKGWYHKVYLMYRVHNNILQIFLQSYKFYNSKFLCNNNNVYQILLITTTDYSEKSYKKYKF